MAQTLRLVGSGLKFCSNIVTIIFFSTSKFNVAGNIIQIYKIPPKVVFLYLYVDTRFFIGK